MTDPTVHIIDRVEVRPGRGREFVDAYLSDYVPCAQARGLALDRILVSPPVWMDDAPNVVTAIWSAAGPAGWWRAAIDARYDPESAGWWDRMTPLLLERTRSSAAAAADVEVLCDV